MKVMELDVIEFLDLLMSHHFDGVLHLTVLELKLWAGQTKSYGILPVQDSYIKAH